MRPHVNTLPKIVLSREELIARLEARRAWAKQMDADALAKHKQAEKEYLVAFRAACKDAAKWDYEKAKRHYFSLEDSTFNRRDRPHCPNSVVVSLDRQLASLRLDQRKTVTVTESNENATIYWLLTHDETVVTEMC